MHTRIPGSAFAPVMAVVIGFGTVISEAHEGSIVTWGYNDYGQCDVPPPNSDFVAIAAGGYFSMGLKWSGSIVAWGNNTYGQCDVPEPNEGFVAIAAGTTHGLGLRAAGVAMIGDLNCDGAVNFDDIQPFVRALAGEAEYLTYYPGCRWLNADCDEDGDVDFDDIAAFVGLF